MERYRILIVDDDSDLRETLSVVLGQEFDVVSAPDGQAALDMLDDVEPDIALIDVELPRMDGFRLCQEIRGHATLNATYVMILSGHGTKANVKRGYEVGANLFIVKPIEPDRLMRNIQVTIERDQLPLRQKRYGIEVLRHKKAHARKLAKLAPPEPLDEEAEPKARMQPRGSGTEERQALGQAPPAQPPRRQNIPGRPRFAIARGEAEPGSPERPILKPKPKPDVLPRIADTSSDASEPGLGGRSGKGTGHPKTNPRLTPLPRIVDKLPEEVIPSSPRDSQVRQRFPVARDTPEDDSSSGFRPTPLATPPRSRPQTRHDAEPPPRLRSQTRHDSDDSPKPFRPAPMATPRPRDTRPPSYGRPIPGHIPQRDADPPPRAPRDPNAPGFFGRELKPAPTRPDGGIERRGFVDPHELRRTPGSQELRRADDPPRAPFEAPPAAERAPRAFGEDISVAHGRAPQPATPPAAERRPTPPPREPEPEPEPHHEAHAEEPVALPGQAIVLPPKEQSIADFLSTLKAVPTAKTGASAEAAKNPETKRRVAPLNLRAIIGGESTAPKPAAGPGPAAPPQPLPPDAPPAEPEP